VWNLVQLNSLPWSDVHRFAVLMLWCTVLPRCHLILTSTPGNPAMCVKAENNWLRQTWVGCSLC